MKKFKITYKGRSARIRMTDPLAQALMDTKGMLEKVKEEAWEEGWSAHFHQTDTQRRDPSHAIKCDNPYRSDS